MIPFLKTHKLLSVLALVLLIGGGWALFSSVTGGPVASTSLLGESSASTVAGSGSINEADQQLQETLAQVQAIQLNTPILSDPAFLSLQDIGQQIVSEPFGRDDPFAPVSAQSVSAGSAQ